MAEMRDYGVVAILRQPLGGPIFRAAIIRDDVGMFSPQEVFDRFLLNYSGKSFFTGGNLTIHDRMRADDGRYQTASRQAEQYLGELLKEQKKPDDCPMVYVEIDLGDLQVK